MRCIELKLIFWITLSISASPVLAKQLNFIKDAHSSNITYNYEFTTSNGRSSNISFQLNKKLTKESKQQFTRRSRDALIEQRRHDSKKIFDSTQKSYQFKIAEIYSRYVTEQSANLPAGVHVEVKNGGRSISVSTTGIPKEQADRIINFFLEDVEDKWQSLTKGYKDKLMHDTNIMIKKNHIDLYKKNYYIARYSNTNKDTANIRIDFIAVARKYASSMRPIALAIKKKTRGWSKREVINYTLNFIQSIPYDTLDSRNAQGPIGFVAPLTLFDINKGDCDTKSTALMGILRHLYPDLNIVMVIIPLHAFIAIDLDVQANDTAFSYQGRDYVVAEAAGPALTHAGKAYPESLIYITDKTDEITDVLEY